MGRVCRILDLFGGDEKWGKIWVIRKLADLAYRAYKIKVTERQGILESYLNALPARRDLTVEAKAKRKAELKEELVARVVEGYGPEITTIYFTEFVMQ